MDGLGKREHRRCKQVYVVNKLGAGTSTVFNRKFIALLTTMKRLRAVKCVGRISRDKDDCLMNEVCE